MKNTTKSQPRVACKVQLKNKKRVYLVKHPIPVVAVVIKVYTFLRMAGLRIFCWNNFLQFSKIESV